MDRYDNSIPYSFYLVFLYKRGLSSLNYYELKRIVGYTNGPIKKDIYRQMSIRANENTKYGCRRGIIGFVLNKPKSIRMWLGTIIHSDFQFIKMKCLSIYYKIKAM